jgi:hypothetical protein
MHLPVSRHCFDPIVAQSSQEPEKSIAWPGPHPGCGLSGTETADSETEPLRTAPTPFTTSGYKIPMTAMHSAFTTDVSLRRPPDHIALRVKGLNQVTHTA